MSGFCARREMAVQPYSLELTKIPPAARQETAAVRRVPRRKTGLSRAKKCPPNSFCRRACSSQEPPRLGTVLCLFDDFGCTTPRWFRASRMTRCETRASQNHTRKGHGLDATAAMVQAGTRGCVSGRRCCRWGRERRDRTRRGVDDHFDS